MNYWQRRDHVRIKTKVKQLQEIDWVITYDNCSEILDLYRDHICKRIRWSYSAATKRSVDEIIIFRHEGMIPDELIVDNKKCADLYDLDLTGQ